MPKKSRRRAKKTAVTPATAEGEAKEDKQECDHSIPITGEMSTCIKIFDLFMKTYFDGTLVTEENNALMKFIASQNAVERQFPGTWRNASRREGLMKLILLQGKQKVFEGSLSDARWFARLARYIETMDHDKNDFASMKKAFDLYHSDDRTTVKFFLTRSRCKCLERIYKDFESVTKICRCCNPECPLPYRKFERKKQLYCTACGVAEYCTPDCQKVHWPQHKQLCNTMRNWEKLSPEERKNRTQINN